MSLMRLSKEMPERHYSESFRTTLFQAYLVIRTGWWKQGSILPQLHFGKLEYRFALGVIENDLVVAGSLCGFHGF